MFESDDCPSENEIVDFLDGGIAAGDRARIEAHCARCERCREALAQAMDDATGAAVGSPDHAAALLKTEIESVIAGVLDEAAGVEAVVGKRIGRFEIVAVQGRGQFGVVYRARDTQLGRMVAVKVMRLPGRQDRAIVETLFRTEAAAAARLQHPNIVTLHDHGELDGAPYLILELLDGQSLRSRLEREGRLEPRDAVAIAIEVTRALVAAHAAGVVHRDIKPGNVFLCTSGQTKVLDFGLAQLQSSAGAADPGEPAGAAARAGTPHYMAPELFRGQAADPCTDVYAVGVMLCEMLDGPPGAGSSVAARIAGARLSPRLRRLLERATASERADRFRTASELLAALTAARDQLAARRHTARRLGIAAAGVVLAATATVAYRGLAPAQRTAHPTVAVLGFDDLSGRRDRAWLSTALSEMLDTDLASSPGVHVVPPERVQQARTDLGLAEGGRVELRTLQDLRRYLRIDYIVTGSYVSVGADAGARTRLDVRIQDAWGVLLDSFSETGGDGELLDVAARIGSRLRVRLAGAALTPDDVRMLRASMPAATEAIRLYAEGLRQWRRSALIEARDVLRRAVAAEPGFPLAHSAFSQVLHALGEEAQMREEARLAFELSTGLRREERWIIEARYREAIDQWPQARELRRMIHRQLPDDLEDGLEFADALERHGETEEALAVITELRRLPPPWREDPRIDLAEIWAQPRSSVRKALAISTADKARALGARWVLARARMRESTADRELGEFDRALAVAEEAQAIAGSLGDREGRSIALYEAATARVLRGDPLSAVIAIYEQALQIEREIGNSDQVANMLGNIAFEYLVVGDPVQAALRLDEMERLAKDVARIFAQRDRAIQWMEQGELARAFEQLEQIRQGGKGRGFELKLLGDVLTAEGELKPARVRLEQFLARDWPPDADLRVLGELAMSRLDIEDGQLARAEARARDCIAICERTHNRSDLANAQAVLADVLVAEHRFEDARAMAALALRLAAQIGEMPEWLDARIALARALAGLHPRDLDAALAEAQAALARARELGLVGPAYEARLAAGEIAVQGHRAGARVQLRILADEADAQGFHLIARKARAVVAMRSSLDP